MLSSVLSPPAARWWFVGTSLAPRDNWQFIRPASFDPRTRSLRGVSREVLRISCDCGYLAGQRSFALNWKAVPKKSLFKTPRKAKNLFQYLSTRQNTSYTYKLLIFENLRRPDSSFFSTHTDITLYSVKRLFIFRTNVPLITVNHRLWDALLPWLRYVVPDDLCVVPTCTSQIKICFRVPNIPVCFVPSVHIRRRYP